MDTMKDGVELINAKPVPRPGRWVSAIIVAILAAMAIHGLVTNKNYQWNVVFQWLFSQSLMQGVAFTIILTVLAMVIGTVLAITMAIMRQSVNPVLRWVAMAYIWFYLHAADLLVAAAYALPVAVVWRSVPRFDVRLGGQLRYGHLLHAVLDGVPGAGSE